PVRTTVCNSPTRFFPALKYNFTISSKGTKRDMQNSLNFLEIKKKKKEIYVKPDKESLLYILQVPCE
uniref:Uncharacterized protein n=1 Tax=Callithrix jacchus TaxID=9483 RepID=A0A8I3WK80_CALJA